MLRTLALPIVFLCAAVLGEEIKPLTRIGVGSCCRQERPQPVWNAVLAAKPELFLMLGDNIYADTEDMAAMKAKYETLAKVEGFAKLRASCTFLATWDDHDYGKNDAGREYPKKKESQQLFLDFLGAPADDPRRAQEGIFHAQTFGPPGKRVQVVLLDTRYHRSPLKKKETRKGPWDGPYLPSDADEQEMLGKAQWEWLAAQLKQDAEVRVICSSIQVVPDEHGWEKWQNLPKERQHLFKVLKDSGAQGVLFVSGDRHFAELSKLPPADSGVPYPLYDLTASSLNQRLTMPEGGPNRYRIGQETLATNFGLIAIDWSQADPDLVLEIRESDGTERLKHALKLSELRGK